MSDPTTSRVFSAAREARDDLIAATWPTKDPTVGMSDLDFEALGEFVQVIPAVGDDASITWQRAPIKRDESFNLVVRIVTNDGHATEDAALDRIEALANVAQRVFYDDTQFPDTSAATKKLDAAQRGPTMTPSQVSFQIGESQPGEWAAAAEIVVSMTFAI